MARSCEQFQASAQMTRTGSPRSQATSCVSPRASGHVAQTARTVYTNAACAAPRVRRRTAEYYRRTDGPPLRTEVLRRESADVGVDLPQLRRLCEEHDAERARLRRHAESRSVHGQDARLAEQRQH